MGNYKVYSEKEQKWITLPLCFQGEQGIQGAPGENGVTPLIKIVNGMWNVSYDDGGTWNEIGPANGTSINDVQAIVDSSTGTPSATASYSGPDNARTLTFRFSGLKGETGPKGADGADGKDGQDGVDGKDGQDGKDGAPGKDGVDGTRFEFIYKRVSDIDVAIQAPASINEDKHIPEGWTKLPQGVTDDLQVEYICQREKENSVWGKYSDPVIWAMYGKIGRDGNGIEYIFKLTKSEFDTPGRPDAPSDIDPESYPDDWSDNPPSITEELPVCWVSIRKQYYNVENGIQYWSDYSEPSV